MEKMWRRRESKAPYTLVFWLGNGYTYFRKLCVFEGALKWNFCLCLSDVGKLPMLRANPLDMRFVGGYFENESEFQK